MERKLLIWSTVVVVACFAAAVVYTPERKPVEVETHDQVSYGSSNAKVEVVVFEEFACPQCRRFHNEVIKPMFSTYIDTDKVHLTLIPVAYLDPSYPSFSAACCMGKAGPGQMRSFLDHIFQMNEEKMVNLSAEELVTSYAIEAGKAPSSDVNECIKSSLLEELRENRISLALSLYGEEVHMPTVLVNGKLVTNTDRQAVFDTIEKELLKDRRGKK